MSIGIIINVAAVALGGLIGAGLGNRVPDDIKDKMTMLFGCCAIGMGIPSIVQMQNLPPVILSVLVGSLIGMLIRLGKRINSAAVLLQKGVSRILPKKQNENTGKKALPREELTAMLVTAIVLFCASGTGTYGAIVSGITGDSSILIAKSVLDFFTAVIFACTLGAVVAMVAIPQCLILTALFLLSGVIMPFVTPTMIADFKGCGGILLIATGFRIMKVKDFPVADMILALGIVMPVSYLWTTLIIPLIG